MNRRERRIREAQARAFAATLPEHLTPVPRDEWPNKPGPKLLNVWRSRHYLVQVYAENRPDFPAMMRMSVNRVRRIAGDWAHGITWDELQAIKRQVGFGDYYAVEVYPADANVIDDFNIRHLWILPSALDIGWKR